MDHHKIYKLFCYAECRRLVKILQSLVLVEWKNTWKMKKALPKNSGDISDAGITKTLLSNENSCGKRDSKYSVGSKDDKKKSLYVKFPKSQRVNKRLW